jgi:tryptophan-rich sensory protein
MPCKQTGLPFVFLSMNNTVKLIIAVAIPLLVGFSAGFFTVTGVGSWYQSINKPSWNPPNWIFGPVWTMLYILMGIALFLVWKSDAPAPHKKMAITLFAIQMALNFFWSFIFFNQRQVGWALAEIMALWLIIVFTIFSFTSINKVAAWLLVPYISWVSFATLLNYTIWKLN